MTTIPILYEDGEALVIDKPGGLPIERPRAGGPSLEDRAEDLKLGYDDGWYAAADAAERSPS